MWAQQPAAAPAPQTKPLVSAGANEVVLDVVVRDKKGRRARDLGAPQSGAGKKGEPVKIRSFRRVTRSSEEGPATAGPKAPAGAGKLDPTRQVRLVTLLFERL